MLQRDALAAAEEGKPPTQSPEAVAAAKELYMHLCDGRPLKLSLMQLTHRPLALEKQRVGREALWSSEAEVDCTSGKNASSNAVLCCPSVVQDLFLHQLTFASQRHDCVVLRAIAVMLASLAFI